MGRGQGWYTGGRWASLHIAYIEVYTNQQHLMQLFNSLHSLGLQGFSVSTHPLSVWSQNG